MGKGDMPSPPLATSSKQKKLAPKSGEQENWSGIWMNSCQGYEYVKACPIPELPWGGMREEKMPFALSSSPMLLLPLTTCGRRNSWP